MPGRDELHAAIVALEAQRGLLGDAVVEVSLSSIRAQLAALDAPPADAAAELITNAAPRRQRRQVTVLFADVAGFTAMSELLDVEDVGDAVNGLWAALDREVIDHGGRVDKHIGDAVMALWGVDGGREDDAERAVRCALAMQSHVGEFVDRIRELAPTAPTPSLRVGLNTGPALLSSVGLGSEFSALGDAVNTASRIESSAGLGEVVIGRATYRLVRGVFFVRERPPIEVKGKSEPLSTYTVEGLRPRAFRVRSRGLEGIDATMVGRAAELSVLTDRTRASADLLEPRVTVVTGEPGVGKSRLHFEFRDWLEVNDPVRYFEAGATEELSRVPYGLLRELLAFRFEISDTDHADAIAQRLVDGFQAVAGAEAPDDAHVLGHLAGWGFEDRPAVTELPSPAALHDRGVEALRALFAGAAQQHPVVVVLDDAHWADRPTLAMFDQVMSGPPVAAVHLIVLARERPDEGLPQIMAAPDTTLVALDLLEDETSRALVREILGRVDALPDDLVDRIAERAGGNPFFVEEIVAMLLDAGAIVVGDQRFTLGSGRWTIDHARLDTVTIPTSVAEVVERRLDGLPASLRVALEAAAVSGPECWDETLAEMVRTDVDDARALMADLEARQFVQAVPTSSVEGATEYAFRHALTRDVTYSSILRDRREALHLAAGRWYARRLGGRVAGRDAMVAQHFQRGGDADRAATWWLRTGQRQEARLSFAEARTAYQLAADLRSDHVRREALTGVGRAATVLGDVPGAREALELVLHECREAHDVDRLLSVLGEYLRLAVMFLGESELADAIEEEGRSLLPQVHEDWARAEFLRHLATRHLVNGTPDRAAEVAAEAAVEARAAGRPVQLAMVLNHLAHARCIQGRLDEALELTEEVLAIAATLDNRRIQMFGTAHLGFIDQRAGQNGPAVDRFLDARGLAEAVGDWSTLSVIDNHLGECHAAAGDLDAAEAAHRRALARARHGAVVETARSLIGLAVVADGRGDSGRRNRLAHVALGYPATSTVARLHAQRLDVGPVPAVDAATVLALAEAVLDEHGEELDSEMPDRADPPGG